MTHFLTIGEAANLLAVSRLLAVELIAGKRQDSQSCETIEMIYYE